MTDTKCSYVRCNHRKGSTTVMHCTDSQCPNWVNNCGKHRTDLENGSNQNQPKKSRRRNLPGN